MRVEIKSNLAGITDQLKLDADEFRVAVMRSLNRAATGLRTDATSEITSKFTVKANLVRGQFRLQQASQYDLVAVVSASGKRLRVSDFKFYANQSTRRMSSLGAQVEIRKGVRKTVRHSFVARMKSGHLGVFTRYGRGGNRMSGRLPIRELVGMDVAGMFTANDVEKILQGLVSDRFEKAMEQNVKFLTRS